MPLKWFQTWFNSPYYHLLYNKRNNQEAEYFINNLFSNLKAQNKATILDIACGRGRHAIYLNKKGYTVTGIDLSIANIEYAHRFVNDTLHFYVHDMRSLFYNNHYDIALNLFTSFGYFDTAQQHIDALKMFNKALKKDGLLVLDFFNSKKVINNLVPGNKLTVNGVDFYINKEIKAGKIIKHITFADAGKTYNFKEVVSAFTTDDFKNFFKQSGFEIIDRFGSYSLEPFNTESSDRLIFICKKTHA
jgi:SAM-dependent methyltransferase